MVKQSSPLHGRPAAVLSWPTQACAAHLPNTASSHPTFHVFPVADLALLAHECSPLHSVCHSLHRLVLADHALVQLVRQPQQLLALAGDQLGDWDARPPRDDVCDVALRDLLSQHAGSAASLCMQGASESAAASLTMHAVGCGLGPLLCSPMPFTSSYSGHSAHPAQACLGLTSCLSLLQEFRLRERPICSSCPTKPLVPKQAEAVHAPHSSARHPSKAPRSQSMHALHALQAQQFSVASRAASASRSCSCSSMSTPYRQMLLSDASPSGTCAFTHAGIYCTPAGPLTLMRIPARVIHRCPPWLRERPQLPAAASAAP